MYGFPIFSCKFKYCGIPVFEKIPRYWYRYSQYPGLVNHIYKINNIANWNFEIDCKSDNEISNIVRYWKSDYEICDIVNQISGISNIANRNPDNVANI